MASNNSTGKYIIIEGHDGTGKSTQLDMLADVLTQRGIAYYAPQEPAGTPFTDELRKIIKDGSLERQPLSNVLLFTAARHEIWQRATRELALGHYVISSRSFLSTLAYQGAGEGLDEQMIYDITERFTDERYMHPDVGLVLSLDNDTDRKMRLAQRDANHTSDTFESRGDDFQTQVREAYIRLASKYDYPLIDASQSKEAVHHAIMQHIDAND